MLSSCRIHFSLHKPHFPNTRKFIDHKFKIQIEYSRKIQIIHEIRFFRAYFSMQHQTGGAMNNGGLGLININFFSCTLQERWSQLNGAVFRRPRSVPFKVNYVVREFWEGRVITITRRMETVMKRFREIRWPGICICMTLKNMNTDTFILVYAFYVGTFNLN